MCTAGRDYERVRQLAAEPLSVLAQPSRFTVHPSEVAMRGTHCAEHKGSQASNQRQHCSHSACLEARLVWTSKSEITWFRLYPYLHSFSSWH